MADKTDKVIDDFVSDHPELPEDHRSPILSWKNHITGSFFIERYLNKGAIFPTDDRAFVVQGFVESFEDMYFGACP